MEISDQYAGMTYDQLRLPLLQHLLDLVLSPGVIIGTSYEVSQNTWSSSQREFLNRLREDTPLRLTYRAFELIV